MTKKVKVFLIVLVIIIAGVGGYLVYNSQKVSTTEEKEVTKVTNKSTTKNVQGNGKTLVVYYSAQNHTKDVAQKVAENLGADLFEIEPKEKYSEDDLDWTDDDSRVTKEHEDTSLRNVELKTTEVENWDQYDTVLIGYPIWWYTYPQIILSFFDQYDLSNKTIIPFVTHGGSGMSGTKEDMEEYLKDENVTVKEGLAVSRTDIEKSQKETVEDWLKELGYK